jgi:ribosomal protein L11 methyltransferase
LKSYPAVIVRGAEADLVAALVDDFSPTAIEPRDEDVRVFFASAHDRDAAHRVLIATHDVTPAEISDEDWAKRSQENLQPVTVGRLTIVPNPQSRSQSESQLQAAIGNRQSAICLLIPPSMAFGTGHHATTRLCLEALQTTDLRQKTVLDLGTGSGVLAIAAALLGAAHATGIDCDPDAVQTARDNRDLNPASRDRVAFERGDLAATRLPSSAVVTANLTGPLLVRAASTIAGAVSAGGTLIVSGLLADERDDVCRAYAPMTAVWEREDEGWAGIVMKKQ